jgi:hypothetical protein
MPIDGPAPAVINALRHAGYDLREIPATPEKLMAAHVLPRSTQSTQRSGSKRSSALASISAVRP